MPLINVKLIEGVFTPAQKQQMVRKLTDAMVSIEGENMRAATVTIIEEVKSGDWGFGGKPISTKDVKAMAAGKLKLAQLLPEARSNHPVPPAFDVDISGSPWLTIERTMDLPQPTVEGLVASWLSGEDYAMSDGVFDAPEMAWQAILQIMQHALTAEQLGLLAAGPLETLLAHHGAQLIDRIEAEAKRSPAFAHLLGGVWPRNMAPALWQRVEKARGGKSW
jgi:4-oxalocrotonate tautomerase